MIISMLNNGLIWYMFLFVEYRCRKQKYCKAQNQSLNMFALLFVSVYHIKSRNDNDILRNEPSSKNGLAHLCKQSLEQSKYINLMAFNPDFIQGQI